MRKKKVFLLEIILIISLVFLGLWIVSAENLNFKLNAQIHDYSDDVWLKTNPNAAKEYDSFDLQQSPPPSNYSEFFSNIFTHNLTIDSWNVSVNPRLLNLSYKISEAQTGELNFSWALLNTQNYTGNFTYYGTDNTYTTPVSSVDMASVNVSNHSLSSVSQVYATVKIEYRECNQDSDCGSNQICVGDQISSSQSSCSYSYSCRNVETLNIGSTMTTFYSGGAFFGGGDSSGSGNCGDHAYYIPSSPNGDLCVRYSVYDADAITNGVVTTINWSIDEQGHYNATGDSQYQYNTIRDLPDADTNGFVQFEIRQWDTGFGNITFGYLITESGPSSDGTTSRGCCENYTDCVDDSIEASNTTRQFGCYANGTLSHDADDDGDNDFCKEGSWYDCLTDSECPSGYTCNLAYACVSGDTNAPNIDFEPPTLNDGGSQIYSTIEVNVSSQDTETNVSTFIDFDNSLVAWWRMDDLNSSGDVEDYFGKYNGSVVGGASQVNGKIGNAFDFDGVDDYLQFGNNVALDNFTEFTFSFWGKQSEFVDYGGIFEKYAATTGGRAYQIMTGLTDEIRVILSDDGDNTESDSSGNNCGFTSNDVWTHIVVVYNSTNIIYYRNGVYCDIDTTAISSIHHTTANFQIARRPGTYFNGTIDDVILFNRSLSAEEVKGLYANTTSKYLYNEFTGLNSGSHTFKAYSQDLNANINTTEQRTVTIESENCNAPTGAGDWTVSGNEVCLNRVIYLQGELDISSGGSLRFGNVTFYMNLTSSRQHYFDILAGGEFIADNNTYLGEEGNNNYYYIRNNGNLTLNNVSTLATTLGPYIYNQGTGSIATITNSRVYRLLHYNANAISVVKNSTLNRLQIYLRGGEDVSVDGLNRYDSDIDINMTSTTTQWTVNLTNVDLSEDYIYFYDNGGDLYINNSDFSYFTYYNDENDNCVAENSKFYYIYYYNAYANANLTLEDINPPYTKDAANNFTKNILPENINNYFNLSNIGVHSFSVFTSASAGTRIDTLAENCTFLHWYGQGAGSSYTVLINSTVLNYAYFFENSTNTVTNSITGASSSTRIYDTTKVNFTQPFSTVNHLYLYGTAESPIVRGFVNFTNPIYSWTSGNTLNRYFPFNVTNEDSSPASGYNVSLWDGSNCLNSGLTDSNGFVRLNISADNNANPYYNYTVKLNDVVKDNLSMISSTAPSGFELSTGLATNFDTEKPDIEFKSPTPNDGSVKYTNDIFVNVSADDSNTGNSNISTFIDFDNSLVAWWRMDDLNSSGDVVDYTGKYNGTVNGNVVINYTNGYLGNGSYFNSISGNIDTPFDGSEYVDLTISVWVKMDTNSGTDYILDNSPGSVGYILRTDGTSVYFYVYNDAGSTGGVSTADSLSDWTHIVAQHNTTGNYLYLDGVFKAQTLYSSTGIADSTDKLRIGSDYAGSNIFNGTIDDVMIFNRSLKINEIEALYANQTSRYLGVNFTDLAYENHTFKAYTQDFGGNVNNTETREIKLVSVSCGDTITSSKILSDDLYCPGQTAITIGANDVVLDCAGHFIVGDNSSNYYGVLADTKTNVTVKNCNIRDFYDQIRFSNTDDSFILNNNVSSYNRYGIDLLAGADYNNLTDNIAWSNNSAGILISQSLHNNLTNNQAGSNSSYGFYVYSSSNYNLFKNNVGKSNSSNGFYVYSSANYNTFINNTAISKTSYGFYLRSSSNNNLTSNNCSSDSNYGILVYSSANYNTLDSNTGTSGSNVGIYLLSGSSYNNLSNNLGISNGAGRGIYLSSASNNFLKNNTAKSNSDRAIQFTHSSYNNIQEMNATVNSGGYGIYLYNASYNNFTNCVDVNAGTDVYVYSATQSIDDIFLNCSYDTESVNGAGNNLIRKWYYRAYVNDSSGNSVDGANVTGVNVSDDYIFSFLTDSSGFTQTYDLIDYVNLGGTKSYYSNYTINATNLTDYDEHQYNVSFEQNNLKDVFTLTPIDQNPPYFTTFEDQTLPRDQSLNYDIDAVDPEGNFDSFAINWTDTFSIDSSTGVLTNTSGLNVGEYYINVSINDTHNNLNSSILLVNVTYLDNEIYDCRTLSSAGVYIQVKDIVPDRATDCIKISSSDVVFNGDGYKIENTSYDAYAFNIPSTYSNITLKNINVTIATTGSGYSVSSNANGLNIINSSFNQANVHIRVWSGNGNLNIINSSFKNGQTNSLRVTASLENVTIDNSEFYDDVADVIYFVSSNFKNITIKNNFFDTQSMSEDAVLRLENFSDSKIYNNVFNQINLAQQNIRLTGGSNIQVYDNNFSWGNVYYNIEVLSGVNNSLFYNNTFHCKRPSSHGLIFRGSFNNTGHNNTYYNCSYNILFHNGSLENKFYDETIHGMDDGIVGLYIIDDAYNNTAYNINAELTRTSSFGVRFYHYADRPNNYPSGNLLYNINATGTSAGLAFYNKSSGENLIIDSVFSGTTQDVSSTYSSTGDVLINVSYSDETVDSTSDLTRKWYYKAYVNDSYGNDVANANVSQYVDGVDVLGLISGSNGWTGIGNITAYINKGGTKTEYNWVNAANDSKVAHHFINTSAQNNALNDVITIDREKSAIEFKNPTPSDGSSQSTNSIYVNVSADDSSEGNSNISTFIDFDNSLVGWWRMDDLNASGDVVDYLGKYNGSVNGNAYQTDAGVIGKGFRFMDDGDYVDLTGLSLDTRSGYNNTVSFWMYVFNTGSSMPVGFTNYDLWFYSTSFGFNSLNADIWGISSSGLSGRWVHVVAIFYNGYINGSMLYIDGVRQTLTQRSGTPLSRTVSSSLRISSYVGSSNYGINASIDDVMIFNRSLTDEEIAELYANQSSKYLGVNFTGLSAGNHNFKAYVQDMAGNVNNTETRDVFIQSVGCGQTITSSKVMNSDLYCPGQTAITIGANDVVLDCAGHSIVGDNSSNYYGVLADTKTNVTVKNCNVRDFYDQIRFSDVDESFILNNNVSSYNRYGIDLLAGADYNNLTDNIAWSNNSAGILISQSLHNNFTNNQAGSNSSYGFYILSSSNNNFKDNTGESNSSYGFYVYSSSNNNVFVNNLAVSDTNYALYLRSSLNNNFTSNNGTSDSSVGMILSSSNYNLFNSNFGSSRTSYGIQLSSSNDNNFTLNTGSSNSSYAFYVYSSSNNNLTNNLGFSNYSVGLYIRSSNNNYLSGNNGTSNSSYGVLIYSSNYNLVVKNTGHSHDGSGFELSGSSYNNLSYNNATSYSNRAMYLYKSENNTLTGDRARSGIFRSFQIQNSNYNKFIKINASVSSGGYGVYFYNSSYNNFSDCIDVNAGTDVVIDTIEKSLNNIFLNCSYDSESVSGENNTLIRKWHYKVYVNDSYGSNVANANVSQYIDGVLRMRITTGSDGWTGIGNITSYINRGGTKTEYNWIEAVNDTRVGYHFINMSSINDNKLNDFITIDKQKSIIEFKPPTPSNGDTKTVKSVFVNVSADDSSEGNSNISTFIDFDNSLVAWWRMDDLNSSGDVVDYFGERNLSIFAGASQTDAGYFGRGFEFDGVSGSKLEGTYGSDFDIGTNRTFTVSAWIYLNKKVNNAGIFRRRVTYGIILEYYSNRLRGYLDGSLGNSGNFYPLTDSISEIHKWYHVALVANGTSAYFYVNGDRNGAAVDINGIGDMTDSSRTWKIGSSAGYFNGTIDDVMVFNRALNDEEIAGLYANETSKHISNNFTGLDFGSHIFKGYVQDIAGNINTTEQRVVSVNQTLTINSPPYADRYYTSPLLLNVTTNFPGSCVWSDDDGVTNNSMSTTDNYNFEDSASLSVGSYNLVFYCNDSNSPVVSDNISIMISEHLVYYVDKNQGNCDDSYSKYYATNESTPYCSINGSLANSDLTAGDEIVVKYGIYEEGIDLYSSQGSVVSGTSSNPIIVRGESDSQRTILNGSSISAIDGIKVRGEDYYIFRYFFITNFSNDGLNVHALSGDDALNITFENITIYDSGHSTPGDGISFHENCTGIGRHLNITDVGKMGIVDIQGTHTWYYDVYVSGGYYGGIYFAPSDEPGAYHYLENAKVYSSRYCLRSVNNITVINFTCDLSSAAVRRDSVLIEDDYANLYNMNISGTNPSYKSLNVTTAEVNIFDSKFDDDVYIYNSNLTMLNVTYSGGDSVLSSGILIRKWYYKAYVNDSYGNDVANANVSQYVDGVDVLGLISGSNGWTGIGNITAYINKGGTKTEYNWVNAVNDSKVAHHFINTSAQNNVLNDVITIDREKSAIEFKNPTPSDGSSQANDGIYVNVSVDDSSEGNSNISTFIDFDNSLVGWWRMDDLNASGDVVDYLGKNNMSVIGNAHQVDDGKMGKGFNFDRGSSDGLMIAKSPSIQPTGNISVVAWVKVYNFSNTPMVLTYNAGTDPYSNEFLTGFSTTHHPMLWVNDFSVASTAVIPNSEWTQVAWVFSPTSDNVLYYVNGNYVDSDTISENIGYNNGYWFIGSECDGGSCPDGNNLNGTIDDVMIFNRSLTDEEIKGLYANQSSKVLGVNFTELIDGNHVFKAYVQDMAGNVNNTETRTVTTNILPVVTLLSPDDGNVTTNRTPTFTWSGSDSGGGPSSLTYEINITCYYDSGSGPSLVSSASPGVISVGSATTYTPSDYFTCLKDNNQYYNWTVRAYDGLNYSDWADERNISISSLISITLPVDSIAFGAMDPGEYDNTSDDSPKPFVLKSESNVETNISVNFTDLWPKYKNPTDYYMFKVRAPLTGCAVDSGSVTTWTQAYNSTIDNVTIINRLNFTKGYQEGCDNVSIDIHVEVPQTTYGNYSSLVTFISEFAEPRVT